MARSPLTLAASVTSALPDVGVIDVATLSEGAAGRYDSAVATLDDGRRIVVRVPAVEDAVDELAAEARALRALTAGVRAVLPFRAPELLGEAGIGTSRAIVVDLLPGYRVDPSFLPAGRGAATAIGSALAGIHALPVAVIRAEGLAVHSPAQTREGARRLVDRADASGCLPFGLLRRWSQAVATDALWQFESTVVLGGADPSAFLLEDNEQGPSVTGMLGWHGLAAGDPAVDMRWLASAPDAADDVFEAYTESLARAADPLLRERARLYAELEYAKWLIHGHESGNDSIVSDAVGLLDSLVASVGENPLVSANATDVDDALALLERVPEGATGPVDTSMHTDTYDPSELSAYLEEQADGATESPTTQIELSGWGELAQTELSDVSSAVAGEVTQEQSREASPEDADRESSENAEQRAAADAAMRRWASND